MGTSFANENPFDDVPQDHWSRTAIVDLVNKCVIKGLLKVIKKSHVLKWPKW